MELSLAHSPALLPIHSLLAHTHMHMHTSTHKMHTYTHKHVHTVTHIHIPICAHMHIHTPWSGWTISVMIKHLTSGQMHRLYLSSFSSHKASAASLSDLPVRDSGLDSVPPSTQILLTIQHPESH